MIYFFGFILKVNEILALNFPLTSNNNKKILKMFIYTYLLDYIKFILDLIDAIGRH